MESVANDLQSAIKIADRLREIRETDVSVRPAPGKWSKKEILGHLIDSASNNHQRIVRMQELPDIGTFSYAQMHWVNSQHYKSEQWDELVNFWYYYNTHLAHIIEHVDPDSLDNRCDMDYSKPATLRFVIEDYHRHVQHHLGQIFSDADPRERSRWVMRTPT